MSTDEENFEAQIAAQVYGEESSADAAVHIGKKTDFYPWHHPIKQIVRDYQWGDLSKRLIKDRPENHRGTVRYFSLPGSDLMDVQVLSGALEEYASKIEYFGFNVGYEAEAGKEESGGESEGYFSIESGLRQAGKITDNAVILPDRLEDIAEPGSQAANRLSQQSVFDIVNVDACDHLAFVPVGRKRSLFDALDAILAHQLRADKSWLLFLTTRVDPGLLGPPGIRLQNAITNNLALHPDKFGIPLAECIGATVATLAGDMAKAWGSAGNEFLKIFSVGLAKHLLQFFHGQPNLPAKVELVSVFAYRVHGEQPDMLSFAFRITPGGLKVHPPTAGNAAIPGELEINHAIAAVSRAAKLWVLEEGIQEESVKSDAVGGLSKLLAASNYDLDAWKLWLAEHAIRPIAV